MGQLLSSEVTVSGDGPRSQFGGEQIHGDRFGDGAGDVSGGNPRPMEVHSMHPHPSEEITRWTAEIMGIETMGQWSTCEACLQAKAKRNAMPMMTDGQASMKGQRLFVDESRGEPLGRHFCGRLYPLQGVEVSKEA